MNLAPADFTVRVDGKARSVVSAEWVPLAAATAENRTLPRVPEGYTSNESSTGGRLIAIAVDEPHIRPGGAQAVLAAANAFIDRLSPVDRIAAVSLGLGGSATPFIADRARVKEAIGRMAGQRDTIKISSITVTGTEALEIADGNRLTADQVVARECSGLRPGSAQLAQCRQDVETEALMLGDQLKRSSQMTTRGLRDVLTAMQVLDGPKTLILMSEGFGLTDDGMANELAALAAATRTSIYALKLDNQLFEITNSRAPVYEPLNGRQRRPRDADRRRARHAVSSSAAPAASCSRTSSPSCPATTCSASSPIQRIATARGMRFGSTCRAAARRCGRGGSC